MVFIPAAKKSGDPSNMIFAQTDSEPFSRLYNGIELYVLFTSKITPPPSTWNK
jgi:hypothetical protein